MSVHLYIRRNSNNNNTRIEARTGTLTQNLMIIRDEKKKEMKKENEEEEKKNRETKQKKKQVENGSRTNVCLVLFYFIFSGAGVVPASTSHIYYIRVLHIYNKSAIYVMVVDGFLFFFFFPFRLYIHI